MGQHIASGATLSVEVTERRIDDRGGGLARVNGMVRLVEGLALPREEDEAKLGHDDTPTSWITIDPLLELFGLTRASLADEARVKAGVRARLLVLPRERGQQLKDDAQLDGWVRDGSLAYIEGLADFGGGGARPELKGSTGEDRRVRPSCRTPICEGISRKKRRPLACASHQP